MAVSRSGSVGTVAQLEAGATAGATLLELTLDEQDTQPPPYRNVLNVFGFPVVGFPGSTGTESCPHPVGSGYLILPDTLGLGSVPASLGVSGPCQPSDTWRAGSLQFDNETFTALSGTLGASGLKWKGGIDLLGSTVDSTCS